MFRFAERGIGYVSFRNRASVSGLETGRYAKRSEDFARLTFLFFFLERRFFDSWRFFQARNRGSRGKARRNGK